MIRSKELGVDSNQHFFIVDINVFFYHVHNHEEKNTFHTIPTQIHTTNKTKKTEIRRRNEDSLYGYLCIAAQTGGIAFKGVDSVISETVYGVDGDVFS